MSERWTYINGEWVPEANAKIHIYDSQFMYGDAVFEMHRTFRHKHYLLERHIDRLWVSMKCAGIPITKTKVEVRKLCDEAIKRNPFPEDEEYRFMINVSRGPLSIYREVFELEGGAQWDQPTWIINVWPLSKSTAGLAHFYDDPADAIVTVQRQIPSQFLDAKVKNRSRMHYQLANLEMKDRGINAMPLLLDDQGFVTESTGANFMMFKDGKLIVPELRNMLRGCSMMHIIEKICPAYCIPVVEKNFEPYDILCADEALFTGTFYNLIPCNKLNGQQFGTDRLDVRGLGPITQQIVKAWNNGLAWGEKDFCFIEQIRGWKKAQFSFPAWLSKAADDL